MKPHTTPHTPAIAPELQPLLVPESTTRKILNIGRTSLWSLTREGHLRSVLVKMKKGNISGRRMYRLEDIHAYVASLTGE